MKTHYSSGVKLKHTSARPVCDNLQDKKLETCDSVQREGGKGGITNRDGVSRRKGEATL